MLKDPGIPGIAVATVMRDDATVRFYGSSDLPDAPSLGVDSLFEIGSVTKTFTATVLADMVVREEVSLEDAVERFLPVRTRYPITFGALATHTAGLPRLPANLMPLARQNLADPYAAYTTDLLFEALADCGAPEEPRGVYSNFGYHILAHALGAAAGTPFPELLRTRVIEPLGMDATSYGPVRTVQGHDENGHRVPNWTPVVTWGAGGLRSCARDMLAYLRAQLAPDRTPLATAIRATHRRSATLASGQEVGLAWAWSKEQPRIVWHNGGTGGFGSFLGWCEGTGRGIVVLYNSSPQPPADLACLGWLRKEPFATPPAAR